MNASTLTIAAGPDRLGFDWAVYWTAFGAVSAAVTAIVAAVAAFLALRQLRLARELSEEQSRPYVVVALQSSEADHKLIDLVISNIGQTVATQVRVTLDPSFEKASAIAGHPFMAARALTEPISSMPPGFEVRLFMENLADRGPSPSSPGLITAHVSYTDRRGKVHDDSFGLDLDAMAGAVRVGVLNVHHIAKTLRAWAKANDVSNF